MATGSALLLRRVLILTRAEESKKASGEEDEGLLFSFGLFGISFPKKPRSSRNGDVWVCCFTSRAGI